LANYQTFMLHLLPGLTSLDTLVLAPETKAAAGATWTKKQLFYSMRGRTLRRQLKEVQREARRGLQVGVGGRGCIRTLGHLACASPGKDVAVVDAQGKG
jgi:hypothetical protein